MKPKTPEEMKKEKSERIQKLKFAEDCYLACDNKKLIPLPQSTSEAFNFSNYARMVPICLGGYARRIQGCPKYRAEIGKLEEEVRALSLAQSSKLSIVCQP